MLRAKAMKVSMWHRVLCPGKVWGRVIDLHNGRAYVHLDGGGYRWFPVSQVRSV